MFKCHKEEYLFFFDLDNLNAKKEDYKMTDKTKNNDLRREKKAQKNSAK